LLLRSFCLGRAVIVLGLIEVKENVGT